jgi:hypothetical protein
LKEVNGFGERGVTKLEVFASSNAGSMDT